MEKLKNHVEQLAIRLLLSIGSTGKPITRLLENLLNQISNSHLLDDDTAWQLIEDITSDYPIRDVTMEDIEGMTKSVFRQSEQFTPSTVTTLRYMKNALRRIAKDRNIDFDSL